VEEFLMAVYILAVETSCDETAASVVKDGEVVLSNVVSSQIETHQRFGGVVPEVASRKHVESVTLIMQQAIAEANISPTELSAVAVTQGPGLVGSLLVGIVAAKAFASALDLPFIGVHHIAGHIYANGLDRELHYPLVSLVVSGGHTELVYMERPDSFEIMGQTRDDAVGEAYDKVARALQMPYPGGPHVDRMAHESETEIKLPRAWLEPDSYDFSFSGLKSAVLNVINQANMKGETIDPGALAKGFQNSVCDVLVEKARRAVEQVGAKQLLLAGGVAANKGLRAALTEMCSEANVELVLPQMQYCTDNAAMIGAAAFVKWKQGRFSPLDMKAEPLMSLQTWIAQ
jgi:N6-L-threonylcarbamoyladenine synthase